MFTRIRWCLCVSIEMMICYNLTSGMQEKLRESLQSFTQILATAMQNSQRGLRTKASNCAFRACFATAAFSSTEPGAGCALFKGTGLASTIATVADEEAAPAETADADAHTPDGKIAL